MYYYRIYWIELYCILFNFSISDFYVFVTFFKYIFIFSRAVNRLKYLIAINHMIVVS